MHRLRCPLRLRSIVYHSEPDVRFLVNFYVKYSETERCIGGGLRRRFVLRHTADRYLLCWQFRWLCYIRGMDAERSFCRNFLCQAAGIRFKSRSRAQSAIPRRGRRVQCVSGSHHVACFFFKKNMQRDLARDPPAGLSGKRFKALRTGGAGEPSR